uniref:Retrovirus-related Pol polyprotein from transposon TNT 1-94 n=1 Tax=Tanacetum cinerariifolium TaxID=118510 RepID=A0A6L2KIU4_TANCI|nr:retrovirus-related Pol polyprotein from transposon TNT 1-94 [Tanacetum cinerariifolium]
MLQSECDVPTREEFTTFSNVLFDADYEFDSSDNQSLYDEDVPEKIFSNPLFEEEITPMKIEQHHYNAESDLIESLRTHDSSIIISSKIDSLLDEFADELALLKSIPPGIDETDCDFEEDIRLIEKLLYDNSSPRPPKEFVSENSDAEIESFSPSPISVEDNDSLLEEINLSFNPDYPMPPGIEDDDYDSEREILISEDLPSNDTLSLPKTESFHFDVPSFSRPLAKPPDAKFDIEKIDGTGDFGLWRIKMRALLIQHGCEAALEVLPADMKAQTKAELNKKAHSAVILCLGNKVLREVTGKTTTARVWSKLETLYMTKSLANKLYLIKKLYTFYMPTGRKIFEHIDEFNKIVLDVANIKVIFEDEDLALLLLTSLPESYEHFVNTLLYGREELTLEDLSDNKECKNRGIGKVMVQMKDGSSFVLHNVSYIPELKRNLISLRTLEKEGYTVKLLSGNVKVINGFRVILSGIRRDNCVYSLDGHAMAGELNASVEEKDSLAQVCHKRLGHIGEAGLQVLEKQGMFGKKSLGKVDFLKNCVLGKSHRVSFSVEMHTTQGVIDYVHSDLWSPSQVKSLGEATCTAAYLINRSPSTVIEKKTPMEMWSGHPSDDGMLGIFDCVAYPHDKQGKLDALTKVVPGHNAANALTNVEAAQQEARRKENNYKLIERALHGFRTTRSNS